jgi:hypothetical protein
VPERDSGAVIRSWSGFGANPDPAFEADSKLAAHFSRLTHTPPRMSVPPMMWITLGGSPRMIRDSRALATGPI